MINALHLNEQTIPSLISSDEIICGQTYPLLDKNILPSYFIYERMVSHILKTERKKKKQTYGFMS